MFYNSFVYIVYSSGSKYFTILVLTSQIIKIIIFTLFSIKKGAKIAPLQYMLRNYNGKVGKFLLLLTVPVARKGLPRLQ